MKLFLRPFLLLAVAALLGACGNDDQEALDSLGEIHIYPVELVLRDDGRPHPAVLAEEQILFRDNGGEPQTLDPHIAEGIPSNRILRDLFEGLTAESPEGHIIPGAAMRWNISRDGKTYTFYLRRDAYWSNGDPVTAEDFVYGLRRSANPATASNNAEVLLPIANAAEVLAGQLPLSELGVTALDEYTLQINMSGPTPYFLGLLNHPSTYPVHKASVHEHGPSFSRPGNLVSNGAYVLKDWVLRSRIELVRNEHYWDADNVVLEQVNYYPYRDQSTALKQFRAEKLHWTDGVPANQFIWLQKKYPDELVISPWLGSYYFGFNLEREPFIENPELRLALALAVNRDLITNRVTQFGELPSYNLVPPGILDYVSPLPEWAGWTQVKRNFEAKRLYANAGYTEDKPLRFEIRYNTGENNKKMALAVASLWKQVLGVQATLVNEETKVFLQNRRQKVLTQVFRAGWIGDYADAYSFLNLFRTGNGLNDYGYSNPMYDSLLDEIADERIPSRRRRLMYEAERILQVDLPFIPVYTYVKKRMVSPRLKGWANNVLDHHYSKDMFLLKTIDELDQDEEQDQEPTPVPGAEIPAETVGEADIGTDADELVGEGETPSVDNEPDVAEAENIDTETSGRPGG